MYIDQFKELRRLFIALIVTASLIFSLTIFMAILYRKVALDGRPHTCRWDKCPYKGVAFAARDSAVTHYIGGDSLRYTDGWCIDMLHIEHPTLEYDQLDSLLFIQSHER